MNVEISTSNVKMEVWTVWRLKPGDEFRPSGSIELDSRDIADLYEANDERILENDLSKFARGYPFDAELLIANLPWAKFNDGSVRAQQFLLDCRRALHMYRYNEEY